MSSTGSNGAVSLSSFPANRIEALAILYLQNQDLSEKTPEEIVRIYNDAYEKIGAELKELRKEEREERRKPHGNMVFFN